MRYILALIPPKQQKMAYIQAAQTAFFLICDGYMLSEEKSLPHITLCSFQCDDENLSEIYGCVEKWKISSCPIRVMGLMLKKGKVPPHHYSVSLSIARDSALLHLHHQTLRLLDVGGDAIVTQTETLQGADWLGFCGIPSPVFTIISIEQQFAEKLHAYTLPRQRANTRVKDIVDMLLLMKLRSLDIQTLKDALRAVFKIRATHLIPSTLDAPPKAWEVPYHELAQECLLSLSLEDAFREVEKVHSLIQV